MMDVDTEPVQRRLERNGKAIINFVLAMAIVIVGVGVVWANVQERITELEIRTQGLERDRAILKLVCTDVVHNAQTSEIVKDILVREGTPEQARQLTKYYHSGVIPCPSDFK